MYFRSLQGLRGWAAMFVVLGHTVALAWPLENDKTWNLGSSASIAHSLSVLLAGHSVWLFFVLSGFVLSVLASKGVQFWPYIISRLVRLYPPVWVALGLILTADFFTRQFNPRPAVFSDDWPGLGLQALLIYQGDYTLPPLWSLEWEVYFSLLLFAFLFVMNRASPVVTVPACIGLSALGEYLQLEALLYFPMFALGVGLFRTTQMKLGAEGRGGFRADLKLVISLSIIGPTGLIFAGTGVLGGWLQVFDVFFSLALISLTIMAATEGKILAGIMTRKFSQWLGKVSFSLYLTHASLHLVLDRFITSPLLTLAIGIFGSLLLAAVFFAAVEDPFHKYAKKIRTARNKSKLNTLGR
jgi:peptidoglycan/LPS O-acetylase OafA/YrhL